ncbi:hypothetical protein VP01_277g1 [Puccinia sorghi]|uniref:Uncharacterized protein n=1 Tax=Puccinia sorghi TaxID=27349 RepID=A0A0L6V2R8_9BASI|nr:hypothetical protein VP01_277g1 [Puccinia sorghi]
MCQGCPIPELKTPHSGKQGMTPHPAIYILKPEHPLTRTPEPSSSPTGLNTDPPRSPLPLTPPQFDFPCVHLTSQAPRCTNSRPPGYSAGLVSPTVPSKVTLIHPILLQCPLKPPNPNPPMPAPFPCCTSTTTYPRSIHLLLTKAKDDPLRLQNFYCLAYKDSTASDYYKNEGMEREKNVNLTHFGLQNCNLGPPFEVHEDSLSSRSYLSRFFLATYASRFFEDLTERNTRVGGNLQVNDFCCWVAVQCLFSGGLLHFISSLNPRNIPYLKSEYCVVIKNKPDKGCYGLIKPSIHLQNYALYMQLSVQLSFFLHAKLYKIHGLCIFVSVKKGLYDVNPMCIWRDFFLNDFQLFSASTISCTPELVFCVSKFSAENPNLPLNRIVLSKITQDQNLQERKTLISVEARTR